MHFWIASSAYFLHHLRWYIHVECCVQLNESDIGTMLLHNIWEMIQVVNL